MVTKTTPTTPPSWRVQAGRLGGLAKSARHDPVEGTQAARAGFVAKFERLADPTNSLPPDERRRRAQVLLRSHMLRLAGKSAKVRAARLNGAGQ